MWRDAPRENLDETDGHDNTCKRQADWQQELGRPDDDAPGTFNNFADLPGLDRDPPGQPGEAAVEDAAEAV